LNWWDGNSVFFDNHLLKGHGTLNDACLKDIHLDGAGFLNEKPSQSQAGPIDGICDVHHTKAIEKPPLFLLTKKPCGRLSSTFPK
jgi:hypothetical protein